MHFRRSQRIVATVAASALAALGISGVWWAGATSWRAVQHRAATFDDVAALASSGVVALITGWVAVLALVTAVSRLPGAAGRAGRYLARHVVPAALRRALPAVFGATVLAAPVAAIVPAHAAHTAHAVETAQSASACSLPAVGRPAAASATLQTAEPKEKSAPGTRPPIGNADPAGGEPRALNDRVVVGPGDSLWSVAAAHVGPDATTADIAREWPRWFAANRDAIGADPDLLHVGLRLTAPSRP